MPHTPAMKTTTAVSFRYGTLNRPVLKVVGDDSDVIIAIRSEKDEHLSLHATDDGPMFTHWSPNKPESTWDALRVSAAKTLGWQDPGRHAHYYVHRPLFPEPIDGMEGQELVGRYINLAAASAKAKYERSDRIKLEAPGVEFMLSIHLSTPGQPVANGDSPHVQTEFGGLYFQANPWPRGH